MVGDVLLQVNGDEEAIISAVFVFLVSLLIGTAAIHLGAQVMIDRDTGFRRAVVTALIGAIVYTLVDFFRSTSSSVRWRSSTEISSR